MSVTSSGRRVNELFGRKQGKVNDKVFVDLDTFPASQTPRSDASIKYVDVAISADLKPISDLAYRGNILILNFEGFCEDAAAKNELVRSLLEIANDMGGTFANADGRIMILSPAGLGIDRVRIRRGN